MKTSFLFIFTVLVSFLSLSQGMEDFINWQLSVEKIDDSHANLVFTGKITEGYHIFSLKHDPAQADGTGRVPEFNFKKGSNYKLVGKLFEIGKPIKHNDNDWVSYYFENKAIFKQQIEVLASEPSEVIVDLYFMLCNMKGCLPPFDAQVKFKLKGFVPSENAIIDTADTTQDKVAESSNDSKQTVAKPLEKKQPKKKEKDSNFVIFIAGFLAGLVALLTPCMFPMIPMTVTFFTRQSKSRREAIFKALVYGTSIILIYVTFGVVFTAATGPLGLNDLSTNVWMNLIFFGIFVFFAFSFLGAFEIQLPSSWVNKMDQQADRGGYLGIFFMAFTLGLVSFSCTGPIIGSLLVEAATSGSYFTPAIGMTGFSLALAIPFTLFAIFPGWLNSLPQSGGWLNSVKVVLGLVELALALKFLSSVDLAYHWGILSREWFVAIWFVLFLIMGIYLLGKLRFSHDSPLEKLSVTRFMFALFALVFAVYLLPGMFGAPLKLIDGIAPPRTNSEDNFRYVNGGLETGIVKDSVSEKYMAEMHPVGDGSILVFHDLKKATEYAKEKNLPILLDFTGHACQNCRKTESTVWTNDEIRPLLQTKFVIASLYCDDRTPLPANEVRYSEIAKRQIKNIGNKWAEMQIEKYNSFQQPLYVVIDHEGNDLTEAIGYTPDIQSYKLFLMKGLKEYSK
ncbi:MAG: thioredoxin family protein [Bacteroidetes bacterium]|nr:thioredoxin family protein [Bacteroidota bacterium]